MTAAKGIIIPKSYEEAITGPQAEEWKEAIAAELASLNDRKTWMVAEVRPNQHRVGTKWVFDLKLDESGKFIIRYKARLVARGFTQKKGFDYQEVFAPVVRHTTIRLFMAIRTLRRMKVLQLDISMAFLNGDIDYDVFITTPKGLEHSLSPNQALKLVKGLYGTKQGARCWNIELTNTLMAHGYEQCVSDPCVFYRKGDASYIIVYVDDLMLFYTIDQTATELKAAILKKYKIGKESDGAYFLGIHSRFGPGVTTMSQETYVAEIVETFGGDRRTIASTPMTVGIDLMRDPKALPFECPYRELNGALLYAANVTRMDIAYAAGMLCRYLDKPEEKHWDAGSRLVDYLRGTKEIGLKFTAKKEITHAALKLSDLGLEAFADADWAADKENRASISGYVVKACGGPISWRSRKQKSIACSTMEAEYVSIAEACKEIVWIRALLKEIGFELDEPTTIFEDNNAAMELAINPEHHDRAKHIDIKYHFVRQIIRENIVKLDRVESADQQADGLTKALPKDSHIRLRGLAGLEAVRLGRLNSHANQAVNQLVDQSTARGGVMGNEIKQSGSRTHIDNGSHDKAVASQKH